MNRIAVSIVALMIAAPVVAQTPDATTICTRGGDERLIEILSPGEVGERCDVRYTRDGGANVRTPYHANNSADFCTEKAAELVNELRVAGFQCAAAAPALRDAEEEPVSDFVVETQRETAPAASEPAPAPEPPAPLEEAAPVEEEPSLQDEAEPSEDDELAALMNDILSQPVSESLEEPAATAAVRGPANLTDGISETVPEVAASAGPVGQVVGADPVEPASFSEDEFSVELELEGATPITQASVVETPLESLPEPAPVQPTPQDVAAAADQAPSAEQSNTTPKLIRQAAVAPTPAAIVQTSKTPTLLRRPADIVRATVRAQAAAWNEGNLEAFMDVYARDDNLKHVSGDEVVRGWSATRKHYREQYEGPSEMGRIDFEKLDAELVTEDVAIVTGRMRHAVGEEYSMADFSLVMKREEGVWRIIHDHSAPATTPVQ